MPPDPGAGPGALAHIAASAPAGEQAALEGRIAAFASSYAALSGVYQAHKGAAGIPLA